MQHRYPSSEPTLTLHRGALPPHNTWHSTSCAHVYGCELGYLGAGSRVDLTPDHWADLRVDWLVVQYVDELAATCISCCIDFYINLVVEITDELLLV